MDAPFRHPQRVAFADTDASGRVHFTRVLGYVEQAEHALLEQLGIAVHDASHGWPRVQVSCEYSLPLMFGDAVDVELSVARLGTTSVTWAFEIQRAGQRAAHGQLVCVHVDGAGRPQPLPEELRVWVGDR